MDACTVAIDALAETGAGAAFAWALAAGLLVAVGVLVLVLHRRRMRRGVGVAAGLLVMGAVAFAVAGPQAAPPAQAAASDVVYSAGCSLITVDEAGLAFAPVGSGMLPGDTVTAIEAPVANAFAGKIVLSGEALLGDAPLAAQLTTHVLFDGAPGPVTLAAGETVGVAVVVTMPAEVGDTAQAQTVDIELRLTAAEG